MTLKKVQTTSFPFLLPLEAEENKSGKIKFEPREIETKYNAHQTVVEVEIKPLSKTDYKGLDLDDKQIQARLESNIRTWVMNGKSLNKCIDDFGDDESEWIDKIVSWEIESMIVQGEKKRVIFAKGAV